MTTRRTTRAVAVLITVLLASVAGAALAGPALAHADLVASTPSELQILDGPPDRVVLAFDDDVSLAFSSITVGGAGAAAPVRTGPVQHDDSAPTTLVVSLLGQVPAGDHLVSWRGVSISDGHPTSGTFSFRTLRSGVAAAKAGRVTAAATSTTAASGWAVPLAYGISRWTAFLAYSCLLGSALLLAGSRHGSAARRGLLRLAGWSWGALVMASIATFLFYGSYASGRPVSSALDGSLLESTLASRLGAALLVRILLLSSLLSAVSLIGPRLQGALSKPRSCQAAVVLSGLALAGTWSAVSHSADASQPAILSLVDAAHLVATGSWLGGVVAIAVVVLRDKGPEAVALTRRFSRAAVLAVVVMVLTGSVSTWRRVGSAAALEDTSYGHLLLVKGGLVLLLLALAGVARHLLGQRSRSGQAAQSPPSLRRLVTAEAALGIVVLAVTSALVTTEPAGPVHAQLVAAHRTTPVSKAAGISGPRALQPGGLSGVVPFDAGTGAADRGSVQLAVLSTRPGPTELHLSVLTAGGEPQPLLRLSAALKQEGSTATPIPVDLAELSPGHYISEQARLPAAGQWQLGMALQLPSGATAVAVAGIRVR